MHMLSPPYLMQVPDGDAVCTIGACFNRDYKLIYRKNSEPFTRL